MATFSTRKLTEIVSLADISDVYNVSTGQDPDEFIIRKIRHGITLYFSSPMRDSIIRVRVLRNAAKRVLTSSTSGNPDGKGIYEERPGGRSGTVLKTDERHCYPTPNRHGQFDI